MDKATLRKEYLTIRAGVLDKPGKSKKIMQTILASKAYQKARVIAVFASMPLEVDTESLVLQAWADHKTVAFPKVEKGNLTFYSATSFSQLTPTGPFNIREPSPLSSRIVAKKSMDLIIVPGLCFDRKNHRLGYGKGFYDRFLLGCPAHKIGVCFDEQRYPDELPITPFDVAVDEVVSA